MDVTPLRIVAFDLSLSSTGFATGERCGTLVPLKGIDRGTDRLRWIRGEVLHRARGADLVVIEGYSYGSQGSAVINIGELGGVIRLALADAALTVVEIPPASLKMFATGKGNAKKEEMLAAAIRQLDYAGHQNDEVDALWLHRMARTQYTAGAVTTEKQRQALAKITWPRITRTEI